MQRILGHQREFVDALSYASRVRGRSSTSTTDQASCRELFLIRQTTVNIALTRELMIQRFYGCLLEHLETKKLIFPYKSESKLP